MSNGGKSQGFEPSKGLQALYSLSRRAPSTDSATLRGRQVGATADSRRGDDSSTVERRRPRRTTAGVVSRITVRCWSAGQRPLRRKVGSGAGGYAAPEEAQSAMRRGRYFTALATPRETDPALALLPRTSRGSSRCLWRRPCSGGPIERRRRRPLLPSRRSMSSGSCPPSGCRPCRWSRGDLRTTRPRP